MVKLNKKGFTLIELLAVIVIMGILMMVAIPAMTRYIENSRRDTFLATAKEYVNSARKMWASDSFSCGTDKTPSTAVLPGSYYIRIDSSDSSMAHLVESGGKSSWGNLDVKGHIEVKVDIDDTGKSVTKYYTYLVDTNEHGIINYKTEVDKLNRSDVLTKRALPAPFPGIDENECKEA